MPYVESQGIRIYYEVEGQGPPLVLQHGFTASMGTWHDYGYVEGLKEDYQLILVEARGHGRSDKPHDPAAYRPEIITGDYTRVLDDLGIGKAHYMGFSMGASIGIKCIARYALNRFHSLVLGGVNPYGYRTEAGKRSGEQMTRVLEGAAEKGITVWVEFFERIVGSMTPEQRARELAGDPRALLAVRKALAEWRGAGDILPEINVPCLIFAGETDGSCTAAREAAKHIPCATFFSLPGLDHTQSIRRSDLVLPHVKRFLAEVSMSVK